MASAIPIEEMKWGNDVFGNHEYVFVHCLPNETFRIRLKNFPVYSIRVRMCHISVLGTSGRYAALMLLLDQTRVDKHDHAMHDDRQPVHQNMDWVWSKEDMFFGVPKMLLVKESFISEWHEVKDMDDAKKTTHKVYTGCVISKWKVVADVLARYTPSSASKSFEGLPKVKRGGCSHCDEVLSDVESDADTSNEGGNDNKKKELTNEKTNKQTNRDEDREDRNDQDEGEESEEDINEKEENVRSFAEIIKIAGCHKEIRYQNTLEAVRTKMADRQPLPLKLEFQPANFMDQNAVVASVYIDDRYEELGTIPKRKIIKVSKAKNANHITDIIFTKPPTTEAKRNGVFPITLTCCIAIIKHGIWERDATNYCYNDDISNLV